MWFIGHFADYHEIRDAEFTSGKERFKAIELGCFYPKKSFSYVGRYYGLFYTGRKPPKAEILKALNQVATDDNYGEIVPITEINK